MPASKLPAHQKGVATLATSLVLLLGITLLTLNSSRMSALELMVSDTYESRHTAFNKSESGLDALFAIAGSVVDLNDENGHVYCTTNNSNLTGCNEVGITSVQGWPAAYENPTYQAKFTLDSIGCAPRWLSTSCSGAVEFAQYTLESQFNDVENKAGAAQTVVGAMELIF